MKTIYNIVEISKYLNISESEVRKLVRGKMIPFFRIGNRLKFDLSEVNKWIEKLQKKEDKNPLLYF